MPTASRTQVADGYQEMIDGQIPTGRQVVGWEVVVEGGQVWEGWR